MDKQTILQRVFGYSTFRPGQEQLIDGVLAGSDVFGIMPTGGGKSMCYQIPGLLLPGVTLVITPLLALMRDQVQALRSVGVPAAYLNSTLTQAQRETVYRNLAAGKYKLVYVTPERLELGRFAQLAARWNISFVAVDEAHCISQWGQDFRPSYLRIVQFINALPRRPILGAFTATATKQVREDVERILELKDPVRTVTGFDRPNLYFEALQPKDKQETLLRLLTARRRRSGIIYCATRRKVEEVCNLLQNHGYGATRYHAGLEEKERNTNQEDFLHDRKTIMVATNAFGMGIDKSNVGFVIHYNMPQSLEAYYQEAGRAGRDGTEADCILLYDKKDENIARYFIEHPSDNEELTDAQRALVRRQDYLRLEAMVGYCKTDTCLRGYILEYFDQKHSALCGNCGNCRGDLERMDITTQSQMILSCVRRIHDKVGRWESSAMVAKVLQGAGEKRVLELGLEELSTFGLMKKTPRSQIRSMMDHLEAEGYLLTETDGSGVQLTSAAAEVLFRGKQVTMLVDMEEVLTQNPSGSQQPSSGSKLSAEDTDLLQALKRLRQELAKKSRIAPYMVFTDATLQDMAKKKPQTVSQFKRVSGVGEIKAAWYAEPFLKRIQEFLEESM